MEKDSLTGDLFIHTKFKSPQNSHKLGWYGEKNERKSSPLTGRDLFAIDCFEVFQVNPLGGRN